MVGSDPLSTSGLGWFYENLTGATVKFAASGVRMTQVGVPYPPLYENGYPNYFGVTATSHLGNYTYDACPIAPNVPLNTPTIPGLSLRYRGQPLARAVSIYASGQFVSIPWTP
jgi:hypothetical protein